MVSDSLRPHGLYTPWNSPGQNTGVGSLSLLQGIFPTQGLNPGLPHCRQILYQVSHKGSPYLIETTGYLPILGHACLKSPMRVTCMTFHEQEKEMGSINHNCTLLRRRRRPRSNSRLYSDVGQTLKCSWPSDEGQEATTPTHVPFRGLFLREKQWLLLGYSSSSISYFLLILRW